MRKFVFCLAVCSVWVTQGVCGSGVEMPALSDDSLTVDMNEVVVTATRTPLPLKNTPVITRVITSRDIERSGAVTLQQALERELAGVEFHQAGYGSSLSFQGLDSRYVLFLLDGERIAGETYGNIDYFDRVAHRGGARCLVGPVRIECDGGGRQCHNQRAPP